MEAFTRNCKGLKKLSCGSSTFESKGMNVILDNCAALEEHSHDRVNKDHDQNAEDEDQPISDERAADIEPQPLVQNDPQMLSQIWSDIQGLQEGLYNLNINATAFLPAKVFLFSHDCLLSLADVAPLPPRR
ncbi:hypothetical protein Fmac_006375 [Flemingia macrophylla]|uniref:Uncharacterized protein n=1 Tax=Flemingia macrophylla TaxID=520843 RepID=A0ABD1NAH0_9FABA